MLVLVFVETDVILASDLAAVAPIQHKLCVVQADSQLWVAYVSRQDFALLNSPLQPVPFRDALMHSDQLTNQQLIFYLQWANYRRNHRFCTLCGRVLTTQAGMRFLRCCACRQEVYPRLAPCIIVRVTHADKILLARSPSLAPSRWSLIAGFVELGETLEEAVAREVQEEVGITVHNIRYWGSQSWPMPASSLMVGFTADYHSGLIQPDGVEVEEAGFFTAVELPATPPALVSIGSRMIHEFFLAHTLHK